jgi:preprotein translocase subunit SecD
VEKALVANPGECPPSVQPELPPDTLLACDPAKEAAYTLGPVALRLNLTKVESMPTLNGTFAVRVSVAPESQEAFAAYTAAHVGQQLAFVRSGGVVSAPMISQPIDSPALELSGKLDAKQAETITTMLRDQT